MVSHQCEIGNKLTEEEQWAKVKLVKEIAEEVWVNSSISFYYSFYYNNIKIISIILYSTNMVDLIHES